MIRWLRGWLRFHEPREATFAFRWFWREARKR